MIFGSHASTFAPSGCSVPTARGCQLGAKRLPELAPRDPGPRRALPLCSISSASVATRSPSYSRATPARAARHDVPQTVGVLVGILEHLLAAQRRGNDEELPGFERARVARANLTLGEVDLLPAAATRAPRTPDRRGRGERRLVLPDTVHVRAVDGVPPS
jgi:hypothetical protein